MGTKVTMQSAGGLPPIGPDGPPAVPHAPVNFGMNTAQVFLGVGSIDSVRAEVDDAFADMKTFHNQEPDQVMRMCGGHSARLSEIRVQIQRIEVVARQWKPIREREVEPAIEELKNQYLIASRLHAVRELDWKMSGGGQT